MKKATLLLSNITLKPHQIHKFRGFMGNLFYDYDLIHNHDLDTGKVIYRYPLIQFKLIDNTLAIIAVTEKAVQIFTEIFMKLDTVSIDGLDIPVHEKDLKIENAAFGFSNETFMYGFQSPWLGLNQTNHKAYEKMTSTNEKQDLLKRILTGNILSMSKSLDYMLERDQQIKTDLNVKTKTVNLKGKPMIGFAGVFKTNFIIPDHLGLGKSVSRGFGMIRRMI